MKNKWLLFFAMITLSNVFLQSCENKTKSTAEISTVDQKQSATKQPDQKILQPEEEVFKGVFEFVEYNDDFDYTSLLAKQGNELSIFVNDKNEERSLLRGDLCEIHWKKDTVYIAGDGGTSMIQDWLISVKKIKDGKVSKLRKNYKKQFKYYRSEEENYSQSYLDKIYLLTEYYIANSKNDLLKIHIQNKEQITYSIENQKRDNKDFTVMGIGYEFEHRSNIFQWLYYDQENDKLYEYDLPNDELNEFE